MTREVWAELPGIWIMSPDVMFDGESKAISLVSYAASFCDCIASVWVARWGSVWYPEGDGCAIGAAAA
jgi:hypothetical protein